MKCGDARGVRNCPRSTMAGEHKATRKRARPDENTDTSTPTSPRKRQATGSNRTSAATTTNTSPEDTPEPRIVQSPYFSPPKKTHDSARKKRLLAASHSLLNENSRFIKRLSATASPAEPTEVRERDRLNVAQTAAAITEHLVSELSKTKSRKRKTRKDPEPVAPDDPNGVSSDRANLTALERQVCICVIHAHPNLGHITTGVEHKEAAPRSCSYVRSWLQVSPLRGRRRGMIPL